LIRDLNQQYNIFRIFSNFEDDPNEETMGVNMKFVSKNFDKLLTGKGLVKIFYGFFNGYSQVNKERKYIGWGIRYLSEGKVGEIALSSVMVTGKGSGFVGEDDFTIFFKGFLGYQMIEFLNKEGYTNIPVNYFTFSDPKFCDYKLLNVFVLYRPGMEYRFQ
jgi:hypothetical protein